MPRSLSVLKAGQKLKPNVSEDISLHKNKTITKRHHHQQQQQTTQPPVELNRWAISVGEKKRAWKNSWEISHQYSASAFQFMWKLGLKIFVFWLALLHVVSALAFVNTNLKHTHFTLNWKIICMCLPSQLIVCFLCFLYFSDTFCCHSCVLSRVHIDCSQGRKRRWQRRRPCRDFSGERSFPDLYC